VRDPAGALSANVTVISPSAVGSVTVWPANLDQPATSTLNFAPGTTRANNAVLPMSLERSYNLVFRGNTPGGRYHLVIDVNGYFARASPP
jgi:hypothetical protein